MNETEANEFMQMTERELDAAEDKLIYHSAINRVVRWGKFTNKRREFEQSPLVNQHFYNHTSDQYYLACLSQTDLLPGVIMEMIISYIDPYDSIKQQILVHITSVHTEYGHTYAISCVDGESKFKVRGDSGALIPSQELAVAPKDPEVLERILRMSYQIGKYHSTVLWQSQLDHVLV